MEAREEWLPCTCLQGLCLPALSPANIAVPPCRSVRGPDCLHGQRQRQPPEDLSHADGARDGTQLQPIRQGIVPPVHLLLVLACILALRQLPRGMVSMALPCNIASGVLIARPPLTCLSPVPPCLRSLWSSCKWPMMHVSSWMLQMACAWSAGKCPWGLQRKLDLIAWHSAVSVPSV